MKRHWWQYILNTSGEPVEDVRIHVFLSDQITKTEIESSDITDNIFVDIASTAYAKLGLLETTPVNDYDTTDTTTSKIETDSNGFFDFWISDKETSYPTFGHEYTQRFTIAWVGAGIDVNCIENIDIFSIHHEINASDNSGDTKDIKNKLLSNQQLYDLNQHKDLDYDELPHNITVVSTTATSGQSDYTTKNKLISNEMAIKFDDHADNDTDDVHTQYLPVDASRGMDDSTLITNLNADKLDSQEGSYYTGYTDIHSVLTTGIHGVTGSIVGTTNTQTLTNKTLTDLNAALLVIDGGTGSRTGSGARINLDAQEQNINLQDIADMDGTNNYFIVGDGSGFTSQSPSAIKTILNYGNITDSSITDFIRTAAPSASQPQQMDGGLRLLDGLNQFLSLLPNLTTLYYNETPMIELHNDTGSVELSGGIGLFGIEPPVSQQTVTDLSSWAAVSSGSDSVNLSDLNTKVQAIHVKLQEIIDALQAYGIV